MPSKLLLADDSVTIQRVIELTFADEDIQVIAVGDGQQAITRIEADRPDIVLADVGMPERDGYEVASFVKQSPHLSHIPVLLLTGAFEPVDEGKARATGCDGVLVKPFEPQMVINRVRDLLAGRRPDSLWAAAPALGKPASPGAAPASSPAPAEPAASGATGESLDDYFDRLDAAFADLKTPDAGAAVIPEPIRPAIPDLPVAMPTPPPAAPAEPSRHGDATPLGSDVFDTLDPGPVAPPADDGLGGWDPGLSGSAPAPDAAARRVWSAQSERPAPFVPPAPPAAPVVSAAPAPHPPEPAPVAAAPAAPEPVPAVGLPSLSDAFEALLNVEQGYVSQPAPAPTPAAITDEVLDAVVERVVERLTSDAVRDTVVEVAERLVREEIERIKNTPR